MNALVLYFSRKGQNYCSGAIHSLQKGNTQIVAEVISRHTGAALFHVQPVCPYSEDYSECIQQAKDDQKRGARPALAALPEKLREYDTIFLGYPNYWGTMPMPMFTLLESVDLSQKYLFPFCTHEGGGFGTSLQDIQNLCPDAVLKPGLALAGYEISDAETRVGKWLASTGKENPS